MEKRKKFADMATDDSAHSESSEEKSWIRDFCSRPENAYFVQVDESYIMSDFNMYKLHKKVPNYSYTLALILNHLEQFQLKMLQRKNMLNSLQKDAEFLFGLIHARFVLTKPGMCMIYTKYKNRVYGTCPRYYCKKQSLLPLGITDQSNEESVKTYCVCCQDVYHTDSMYKGVDGAFFTTSLPHMFVQMFAANLVFHPKIIYVPRIFGFKVHENSREVLQARSNLTLGKDAEKDFLEKREAEINSRV